MVESTNRNFLLTFTKGREQGVRSYNNYKWIETTFAWFDTEEELNNFIATNKIYVIDKFKINDIENLNKKDNPTKEKLE